MTGSLRLLFLHHSVGLGILEDGQVRQQLRQLAPAWQLFDHGYNNEGLRDQNGVSTGRNFNIPNDDTNPIGYLDLFSQPLTNPPTNAFSQVLEYDVIIFKSCFPVSEIKSEPQLAEYKAQYRQIRQIIGQYPPKFFILFTQPPLTALVTDAAQAKRALALVEWLKSDEFCQPAGNLAVFDLFSLLADTNPQSKTYGTLRPEYRRQGLRFWKPTGDSHPNEKANRAVAKPFVEFIFNSISNYRKVTSYELRINQP
jgi:hypothetical protein